MNALTQMAWPAALAIAWVFGEVANRWLSLPRISAYGIAGFAMASSQGGFLGDPSGEPVARLADFAFTLILFEMGYRVNLQWLRHNRWLGATSVIEATGTFAAVFLVAQAFAVPQTPALLLAALAMSTSPAAVLRVANDTHSAGQVTERVLHLTAFNSILAVIAFKAVIGYWVLESAGSVYQAIWHSLVVLIVSGCIGALFGVAVPGLLRLTRNPDHNPTVAFAIAALLLTALTHTLNFSPLLAALTFGMVARHRRIVLTQAQRNFGVLGDLLTVLLFVFVAASLEWRHVTTGIWLALAVIAARLVVKTAATTLLARPSGTGWRKGWLTGLAMMPMSVFVILLLEQTRHLHSGMLDDVAGIAAIVLLLEIIGPIVTQQALRLAGETQRREDR
ncbi:cation:proton antiporter [Propionivibrio sp.]|uniref:cation:proton antiporter n=1 Tax=Propionivibrio sp. TaxID=2212460 RepID=UPI002608BA9E|nr:cation:proton antiporter [Propionivibrio sp.]